MNSWTTKLILLLFTFHLSIGLSQEQAFLVHRDQNKVVWELGNFSHYLNEDNRQIKADSLVSLHLDILNSPVPNFGFETRDVWLRTKIEYRLLNKSDALLVLGNCNLDIAEIFLYDAKNQLIQHELVSDLKAYSDRKIHSRKPVFNLHFQGFKKYTLLLRLNNGGEQFHTDINFSTKNEFHELENSESYFLGIFMGLLFFSILVNVYMFILTKDKLSFYYSFYLIALFFLQGSLLGFGKIYAWPNSPFWSNHANPIFASLSVYFLILFARHYLTLPENFKKIDRIFKWIGIIVLAIIVLSFIPNDFSYRTSVVAINVITLLLNLCILPIAIYVYRAGHKQALLFFVAFTLLVLSVFAFILKNFGVIPANFLSNYGFQIGSAMEVLLFSLGIIIRFRNVQRDAITRLEEINFLKEKANEELEQKVEERTIEINLKKVEIEEKNKEIVDSINYAKRIQLAILPPNEKLKNLLPGMEVFYQPKDIVSGDFYWIEEKSIAEQKYSFIAVADCTGHGVPGAMMSVLCNSILNRVLETSNDTDPALFLERVDQLLKSELSKSQENIRDGMDLGLVIQCQDDKTCYYAGANIPLWILRNREIIELDSVHRPIGFGGDDRSFEGGKIETQVGDTLLLFSDGLVDQFGGAQGKKIRKKLLREWILESPQVSREELQQSIAQRFNTWKGKEEQTDDVTLLLL